HHPGTAQVASSSPSSPTVPAAATTWVATQRFSGTADSTAAQRLRWPGLKTQCRTGTLSSCIIQCSEATKTNGGLVESVVVHDKSAVAVADAVRPQSARLTPGCAYCNVVDVHRVRTGTVMLHADYVVQFRLRYISLCPN